MADWVTISSPRGIGASTAPAIVMAGLVGGGIDGGQTCPARRPADVPFYVVMH